MGARRDLPLPAQRDGLSPVDARLQFEASTLDAAGERTRRLLQTMTTCLGKLQTDAHGLLQYLGASELLREADAVTRGLGASTSPLSSNAVDSPMLISASPITSEPPSPHVPML